MSNIALLEIGSKGTVLARRSRQGDPKVLSKGLVEMLQSFHGGWPSNDVRAKVRELIPVNHTLRDLGGSLMGTKTKAARARILEYLLQFRGEIIHGDELMVVAGISEYARRIRELRKQAGWNILSGHTANDTRAELLEAGETDAANRVPAMVPDEYLLQSDKPDVEAAERWKTASRIRKSSGGVQKKILEYFKANLKRRVMNEELRYVAGDKSEWARRTRELRTEAGYRIVTRFNGDPSLPVGVYVLEELEPGPEHDRHIEELVRREVMQRDGYKCQWKGCGWSVDRYAVDPRFLEVHHIEHHKDGGSNEADNLVTLCNLHHDQVHKTDKLILEA